MSVITEMEDKTEKQAVEIHCTRFYQVPDKPMFTGLIKISELLKLDQQEQLKVDYHIEERKHHLQLQGLQPELHLKR